MALEALSQRVAIITGAGRGIGRAISILFAHEGALIAGVARTAEELASLEGEIENFEARYLAIVADVAKSESAALIVHKVRERFGTIDILVNNAGVGSVPDPRPISNFNDASWDYTLAVNLTAPYRLSKAVVPTLVSKKWGRIINIASLAGKVGLIHGAAYSASKHGLLGLTQTLALELARDGVTVNAICPGPVRSRMNDERIHHDAARMGLTPEEYESRITPIGRRLDPSEIAPMVAFLASDGAATITGQAINVCGGSVMS